MSDEIEELEDDDYDFYDDLAFKNNTNLRPCGVDTPYTDEQAIEIAKCAKDPIYFISKYIKVIHPDRGLVLMELYEYQKRMIRTYHKNRFSIAKTSRQMGKTTVAAAFFIWYILFNDEKSVAILANKQSTADEVLARIRLAYENLPKWLQQGVATWNKRTIELENKSKVFCAATSSTGIRGKTINILYLDEMAFIPNTQAEDFFTSVYPTITASTKSRVIITSTPNGFNAFYKFWNEAENKRNGFKTVEALWHEIPGRDQKWYDEQRAILGDLKAAQELDATFLGSSMQLLTPSTMARLSHDKPIKEFKEEYIGLRIYEIPKDNKRYVMTVDVSRGRHLDDSAFIVFDVTTQPYRIVAAYNNNEVSPLMYSAIVHKVCKNYNDAYALIEINDVGSEVASAMYHDFEYENMFWSKAGTILGKTGSDPYPGIRTTKKTKRIGCATAKDLIERNNLLINDFLTISQFSTFIQSTSGSYEADEGFKDDMVMCVVLFAWLATQPWFKDLTDQDMRTKMYSSAIDKMDHDLPVNFGFSDGREMQVDASNPFHPEAMSLLLH